MAAAFLLGRDMNYQQAFVEHYKAVRARITNQKPPQVKMLSPPPQPEPEVIEPPEPRDERPHPDPRMQILRECAKEYGCTVSDMLGKYRNENIILARRKAMWRLHKRGTMSLTQIGRYLNKDHSTVLHALRKYEKSLAQGEAK